ncbi:MAG: hypothetical protein ACFE0P_13105 [Oceanicaulis sp.]
MISGICALGLVAGAYLVCPEALQNRIHEALTPPDETLAELQAGFDALADYFNGPGQLTPEVRTGAVATE